MITIKRHSGIYTLMLKQQIPGNIATAWKFFSAPGNLALITPEKMDFNVTSEYSPQIYPGQIISYKIKILPFIKSNWVTEITHVKENNYFVDEQRLGPYKMWHHEHFFEENEMGVLVTDKVSYKIPFGIFGILAHELFVRKTLISIFTFRLNKLKQIFY